MRIIDKVLVAIGLWCLGLNRVPVPIRGGTGQANRLYKKSAIGASSVTLVPATSQGGTSEAHPGYINITQIVLTTPSTPPVDFFGTTTTDGVEYEVHILRKT